MIFFFKTFEWQKKLLTLTLIVVLYWETCFHKSWIATGQDCFSKEGKWNAVWLRVSLLNSLLKPKDVLTTPNCCCCLAHSGQKYGNVPKISRNVPKMSQSGHFETFSGHFTSKRLINVIKVSCTKDEQDLFKKPLKICFWLFPTTITSIFCTIFAFLTHYVPATSSLKTLEGAWSSVKYRQNYIISIIT